MLLETWILFAAAYLAITFSPGPNVLAVLSHATKYGFSSIFTTIFGNLLCQLFIVIAVSLGIGALLTVDSVAYLVLKQVGALYLIYVGGKTLYTVFMKNNDNPVEIDRQRQTVPFFRIRFQEAFLVSASNPKTVIFLAAFLPQFLNQQVELLPQFVTMYLTIAVIVASIHTLYALIAVVLKRHMKSRLASQGTSAASGLMFVVLGFVMSQR